jgi:hypothetical protein
MAVAQPTRRSRQAVMLAVLFFLALFLILAAADAGMITPVAEKCPLKIPKWFGCLLAKHETLSGSLITAGGALFAAWVAWHAVMDQIKSDRELAHKAQRAIVFGGPGHRIVRDGVQVGIVFTGQNTGVTAAITKKICWGLCKQSEWPAISKNWIEHVEEQPWDEVLPPQMKPGDRYPVDFTATLVPDDNENHVCYGSIVYTDVSGREFTTTWKHSVVRDGNVLKTSTLPGGYSSEWEEQTDTP